MLKLGYIFEISKIEKFLIIIFILLFILTLTRIVFINLFSRKFFLFCVLIGILIGLNIFICFFLDLITSILVLIVLSFFSLFAILIGYGVSFEICFIIPFKLLADIFLILYLGSCLFFVGEWEVVVLLNFYSFSFLGNYFLFLAFLIYSLCGVLGFWIYWAMEGSYFISCYLHSVGFILISTIILIKAFYLGLFEQFSYLIFKLEIFFFFSFLFFLMCFLVVKKIKKGFGYFSCSGVSFVFLLLIISPSVGIIYFFLSSILKIIFFELMGIIFGRFIFIKSEKKDKKISIKKANNIYWFLLISILSIIFLVYGEFFYFYSNSDGFLDFYFLSNFLKKTFYFFFYFKAIGIYNLIIKINFIFLKTYLTIPQDRNNCKFWFWYFEIMEKGFFSKDKIFLLIYLIFNYFFKFNFHFMNFFFIMFFFLLLIFDSYKIFKINSLEHSVKYIFWKLFSYFLEGEDFRFNFKIKKSNNNFSFSFLKSSNIIFINFSFTLFLLLFLF